MPDGFHGDVERRSQRVLLASLGAPEVNRLSVELMRRGALSCYVRPYVNKGRRWERCVAALPGVGHAYARTLGRREPPAGLCVRSVIEAGVTLDFLGAAVARWPLSSAQWRRNASQRLLFAAERAVARKAGGLAGSAGLVVASYGTGLYAFESVRRRGGRSVLSYPIAHNGYQARFYAEEANLSPEFAAALPRLEALPREYSERLETECALADRILVGSTFVKESFVATGHDPDKIMVSTYGVDTDRFYPRRAARSDGVFRALFVGQIGQRKGMSYLFQAYELFRRHDSELHVVGSYVSGHEVYDRYKPLYRHTANVPHKDLVQLFHEADVFVFPSLIEGMPLVVLEAMACGVPVITTTHGPGDVVRDGIDGFLVPIRDPEAIAARLDQLYRDSTLREQLGRNAREQALRHTWTAFAQRTADLVLALLPR